MQYTRNSLLVKIIAVLLIVALTIPMSAFAATPETVQPYASNYLTSYNTYICTMGSGKLQIWFEVMGTGDMDELGTLSIRLYESTDKTNWTLVKTFLHEDYESMLIEDDYWHMDYVSYNGVARRYYKAYVCIWAGKNNGGDTRYMWTPVERAT